MSGYGEWTFKGVDNDNNEVILKPQFIKGDDGIDWSAYPQITLHCLAFGDNNSELDDARDEIRKFFQISSRLITIKDILAGGTSIQTSADGQILTITEGENNGTGAMYNPQFTEHSYAKLDGRYYIPSLGIYTKSVIEWDLIFILKLPTNIY